MYDELLRLILPADGAAKRDGIAGEQRPPGPRLAAPNLVAQRRVTPRNAIASWPRDVLRTIAPRGHGRSFQPLEEREPLEPHRMRVE